MKKILLATVSALALNCAVHAADMPVKTPRPAPVVTSSWTGWYIGLQGGIVDHDGTFRDLDGFLRGSAGSPPQTYTASDTGGIFGGHIGYNWQRDRLVVGLEADVSGVGAKAGASAPPPAQTGSTISFNVDWLATIRGRFGATITDATLLYLTGGLAFGHVKNNATLMLNVVPIPFNQESTKTGWTIGGGIEHMLGPRWTARAEVRYVDLGHASAICPAVACEEGPYRGEFSNKLLMGLVGVTLKF